LAGAKKLGIEAKNGSSSEFSDDDRPYLSRIHGRGRHRRAQPTLGRLRKLACPAILIAMPETRDLRVPPYFWVLIAMISFEITLFAFWRGLPGRTVSNGARLLGFVLAVVIMVVLPILAGSPGRLF
jgi:hypothetical protein